MNKTPSYILAVAIPVLPLSGCAAINLHYLDDDSQWQNVYSYGEADFSHNEIQLLSTGNWFYLSQQKYKDFVLQAEVLMPETKEYSNSGIIFRAQIGEHQTKGKYAFGYQAEVDPSDRQWSGGLYEQGTKRQWLHPIHATRSFPDQDFKHNYSPEWDELKASAYRHLHWNKYKVEANGSIIKIWVNDSLTTHIEDTKFAEGFIGIQHKGSWQYKTKGDTSNVIRFRNIQITEL